MDTCTSLLLILQGLSSTSEMSKFIAGCLHSVSTAASAKGIRHDAAPDDNTVLALCVGLVEAETFFSVA